MALGARAWQRLEKEIKELKNLLSEQSAIKKALHDYRSSGRTDLAPRLAELAQWQVHTHAHLTRSYQILPSHTRGRYL